MFINNIYDNLLIHDLFFSGLWAIKEGKFKLKELPWHLQGKFKSKKSFLTLASETHQGLI